MYISQALVSVCKFWHLYTKNIYYTGVKTYRQKQVPVVYMYNVKKWTQLSKSLINICNLKLSYYNTIIRIELHLPCFCLGFQCCFLRSAYSAMFCVCYSLLVCPSLAPPLYWPTWRWSPILYTTLAVMSKEKVLKRTKWHVFTMYRDLFLLSFDLKFPGNSVCRALWC
jgi:hypothetical protein